MVDDFTDEEKEVWLAHYRKLQEKEKQAEEFMGTASDTDRRKQFARYKCEIVDALCSYVRLFEGCGVKYG